MVATAKQEHDTVWLDKIMAARFKLHFVEWVGRLRRYVNQHNQCFVEIVRGEAVIYSFHEVIEL